MQSTTQEEPVLTSDQQQILDDGLRILVRLIIKRSTEESPETDGPPRHPPDGND